jgi:hypothetical protein
MISMKPCLFDLGTDPCETNNLAGSRPDILLEMLGLVNKYEATLVPQINKPPDSEGSDPRKFNNTWSPWIDTKATKKRGTFFPACAEYN